MAKPKVENETKEDRFRRIASSRTQKVLDTIQLLGKCSNKAIYAFSDKEVKKIFNAIERELREVKNKFSGNSRSLCSIMPKTSRS